MISSPDQNPQTIIDYVDESIVGRSLPFHTVAYNCSMSATNVSIIVQIYFQKFFLIIHLHLKYATVITNSFLSLLLYMLLVRNRFIMKLHTECQNIQGVCTAIDKVLRGFPVSCIEN